jgi:hypothetical protein
MKRLILFCATLLPGLVITAQLSAQTFTEAASFQQMVNGGALDWADYDHDGDLDLLVASQRDTTNVPITAFIYRNDGNDIFTEFLINSFPVQYFFAEEGKLVDLDNDGWVDIVMSLHGASSNAIVGLKNDGAGGFLPYQVLLPSTTGKIAFADIDLDGDEDMAVSAYYHVKVYRNDGNMVFTNIDGTQTNIQGAICFGKLDGDNYPDLVVSGQTSSIADYHTYLFRNDMGTGFTSMNDLGDINGCVSLADADGDNDNDLLISGNAGYNTPFLTVYINNGNFVLDSISPAPTALSGASAWLDADQDGDMDFICSGYYSTSPLATHIMLYTNNGSAVFSTTLLSPPLSPDHGVLAVADYNNDQYPDFAILGQNGSSDVTPRVIKNMLGTGIESVSASNGFSCFPSPATGILNLVMKQYVTQGTLMVYDVTGKILQAQEFADGTNFTFDLSKLTPGVYIVRVTTNENTFVQRILKQ